MVERFLQDVVTALRAFRTTPIPVAAAVVTLAFSVGVNLAMFGLIDRALLSPPSRVAEPERIFTLGFHVPGDDTGSTRLMTTTSYVNFRSIHDQTPALAGAAAFQRVATSLIVNGDQRRVNAMLVSGGYFDLLGARPWLGHGIGTDDETGTAAPSAVLSHAFWSSALRGNRDVLGARLNVGGLDYTVSGVMPEGFSGHSTTDVDLWVPFAGAMRNTPGWDRDSFHNMASIVVRLEGDQTRAAAATQASAAIDRGVELLSVVGTGVAASEQRVAWWLAGVSVLVLAIGLANTATLLVVRRSKTRIDLAIRAALGASRARLIRQALLEAALLSVAATAFSLVLASWMDETLRRVLFPGIVSRGGPFGTTLWIAAAAGAVAALVAAAANTWRLPVNLQPTDIASGHGTTRRSKTMTGLLVVQTTLSVLLIAGAGMFGGSLYRLWAQDFGMRMDDVLVVDFDEGTGRVEGQDQFFASALDRIRQLPAIEVATPISAIPFSGFHVPPIAVPGHDDPPSMDGQLPFLTATTPELLKILGIHVVEGRALSDADDRGAPVVMVNQTMARVVWPGESAVGKCFRIGFAPDFNPATHTPGTGMPRPPDTLPCRVVIGVTRDVRQRSVLPSDNEDRLMQYFVPFSQVPDPPFASDPTHIRGLLLRSSAKAETLSPVIRRLTLAERTDLPFLRVRPYTQLLERQMRPWSIGTTLLGWFSLLALTVAAVGLYAAFAHAVAERRREMAIRMAVGARPNGLVTMVLREALVLAGVGGVLGCMAAVMTGQWVQSLLFGTAPTDPLVLGSAVAVMLLVAAASTLVPARTASKADPSQLLRVE